MAYTAAIGEKGATVGQVRKMEMLLDAKIGSGGLEDAPSDGDTYGRSDGDWVSLIGPQGPKGDPGEDGTDGSDGKSAYQYAVDGGFTGTEAQFTALLNSWLTDAPSDGGVYVRVNGTWAVVTNATVTTE